MLTYRSVANNLQVKEVWVGDGERRRRYLLCLNPEEAERQRQHREQVLVEIAEELALLRQRTDDHPKAACTLLASRRYGRYLSTDYLGRPKLDSAKVKDAEKFDGKFVVITNDDTLSAEDVALGYKGAWIIESCFRRMKQTGLQVRPMFHWMPRRIEAHVRLCVLALQMQRAAEIRCGQSWAQIAHLLAGLKAIRYSAENRTIVQRTKIATELADTLKKTWDINAQEDPRRRPAGHRGPLGIDTRLESAFSKSLINQRNSTRVLRHREPRAEVPLIKPVILSKQNRPALTG